MQLKSLDQYAADQTATGPDGDLAECQGLIRHGSHSFHAASRVLPGRVRRDAVSIYAFCRLADDAVDAPDAAPDALDQLERRLDRIYAGKPAAVAADRAFQQVAHLHGIPKTYPAALLEGFAWDGAGRQYETIGELRAYAARVAGAVGGMVAMIMGVRRPEVMARACDLGVAMQLTNIARDVGEDARQGRLYLPRTWMREAGLDPDAWLAAPRHSPELATVVRRLLDSADTLYARADAGIAALPAACRPGICAASRIYAGIGGEVARAGYDSINRRAVVPKRRKLQLLGAAVGRATGVAGPARADLTRPPLPETQFLVQALDDTTASPAAAPPVRVGQADEAEAGASSQIDFVLDLFMRLREREALQETAGR
jgi:phytoene synthase